MKTTKVNFEDIAGSVVAVPPLARNLDLSLNRLENQKIVRYLESAGVTTLMYGGNANLYNVPLSDYRELLELVTDAASEHSWVIPSVGPDYGRLIDQCALLRNMPFPAAMVLPLHFPATARGVETGIRRFTDAYGRPVILYIRSERYLKVEQIASLVEDGSVIAIKYAIVREDPGEDDFLGRLVQCVDKRIVLSGLGEHPAIAHMQKFGVAGFTSGLVCIAPRSSSEILHLLKEHRWEEAKEICRRFLPLDNLRRAYNPISVLHDAVALAGIANTGPVLPMLSNLGNEARAAVCKAAVALLDDDTRLLASRSSRRFSHNVARVV